MAFGSGMQAGAELGAGLGAVGGSLLARGGADNSRRRARGELAAWRALYQGINPEVQVQHEEAYNLGPSAVEEVGTSLDPSTRAAQARALRTLMGVGAEGGMDPQSQAALLQAQAAAAREQRAAQGALRQSFASRGTGGGGLELGLSAAAGQQAANANAMAGAQAAADARARQLQALASGAGLAGQMRGADYGQAMDRAGARDRVAEYNARNSQAVRGRNIDRQYAATQQSLDNRFRRADGQAASYARGVNMYMDEAERKMREGQGMGSAIGRAGGAAVGAMFGGG